MGAPWNQLIGWKLAHCGLQRVACCYSFWPPMIVLVTLLCTTNNWLLEIVFGMSSFFSVAVAIPLRKKNWFAIQQYCSLLVVIVFLLEGVACPLCFGLQLLGKLMVNRRGVKMSWVIMHRIIILEWHNPIIFVDSLRFPIHIRCCNLLNSTRNL